MKKLKSQFYIKNKEQVDVRYKKFKSLVNMSAKEMKAWKSNKCSKAASIKRLEVVNRVTRLLEKSKTFWTLKDYTDSAKVISYLSRAVAIKDSVKPATKLCRRGKNYYALKNWAFDRNKIKNLVRKNPNLRPPLYIDNIESFDNYFKQKSISKDLLGLTNSLDFDYNHKFNVNSRKYEYDINNILYGFLEKAEKSIYYHFNFNPLNQWKYEKDAKLPVTHDDNLAFMEEDSLFENDEPTFKFLFINNDNIRAIDIANDIMIIKRGILHSENIRPYN